MFVLPTIKPDYSVRTQGIPWSKIRGLRFTSDELKRSANYLIEQIIKEATAAISKGAKLPKEVLHKRAYIVQHTGNGVTVEMASKSLTDMLTMTPKRPKSAPFRMDWLTQQNGVFRVPMKDTAGNLIFRTTPLLIRDAWVHPGIARSLYIKKAVDRAYEFMGKIASQRLQKLLSEGNPFL